MRPTGNFSSIGFSPCISSCSVSAAANMPPAWKIAASPLVTKLWCAPGNAGIAREAECVTLDVANHAAVIDF